MMKKMKNNLDECQELKLLQIERRGCWLAFWTLLLSLLVQMLLGVDSPRELAGEWFVLIILAVYIVGACVKNGIWDRKLKPSHATNFIACLAAGTVVGLVHFTISYQRYHKIYGSIATGIFMFLSTFLLCFAALSVTMALYKKRLKTLEDIEEEADE